jgi:hypothetical protein
MNLYMRNKNNILMAFASLIIAITANAAPKSKPTPAPTPPPIPPVTITAALLPFSITAPGTYVLSGNLVYPLSGTGTPAAITVAGTVNGAVIIDLKGFTLSTNSDNTIQFSQAISIPAAANAPSRSITIRNGTLYSFMYGLKAASSSNLLIDSVLFSRLEEPLSFDYVSNSTVSNCTFDGKAPDGPGGVNDNEGSGNTYSNDTFLPGIESPFSISNDGDPVGSPGLIITKLQLAPIQ